MRRKDTTTTHIHTPSGGGSCGTLSHPPLADTSTARHALAKSWYCESLFQGISFFEGAGLEFDCATMPSALALACVALALACTADLANAYTAPNIVMMIADGTCTQCTTQRLALVVQVSSRGDLFCRAWCDAAFLLTPSPSFIPNLNAFQCLSICRHRLVRLWLPHNGPRGGNAQH